MIRFFMSMGLVGPIMLVIAVVILVLTVARAVQIFSGKAKDPARLERGLDAILFWGVFCVVLGFFGQVLGHYKVLTIMIHAEAINPRMVFMGLAECLSSTLFGLTILLLTSLAWFTLRSILRWQMYRAS